MLQQTNDIDACPSFHNEFSSEPPEWEWVSLSEALTWIAFYNSMDSQRLSGLLERVSDPEKTAARAKLEAALYRLLELGRMGIIEMTGKFISSPDILFAASKRCLIPAREFKQYTKYEADFDGLRRWLGHIINCTVEPATELVCDEMYCWVEVHRASLITNFLPVSQSPVAASRTTSTADIECAEWLTAAFKEDSDNKKNKQHFAERAIEAFEGRLSLRGFHRAWAKVAPAAGRSQPGRKS